MGEKLVAVRLRLPASVLNWWKAAADKGGGGVSVPDFLRRHLCEAVPLGLRTELAAQLAAGGGVGRGLARASKSTRRAVCADGLISRQAERAALLLLCQGRRKRGPGQGVRPGPVELGEYLATADGQALVEACRRALQEGRPPLMPRGGWAAFDLWRAGGPPRGTAKQ